MRRRTRLRRLLSRLAAPITDDAYDASVHPPVEDLVDEALVIAGAALRLAAKNRLILSALRERADYDDEAMLDSVRAELRVLAAEKDRDAARVRAARTSARSRRGLPAHEHDYRRADLEPLRLREQVSADLATRLRELADDTGYVRGIVDAAREAALDDIAATMRGRFVEADAARDKYYRFERDERMDEVRADLERLRRRAR